MFFGGYVNPATTSTCGPEAASNFMGFMLGTGVCCGLGTMMFAALFTQYINAVSTAATRAWLLKNLWVMILPMFFLVCGIGCMSMVVLFVAGCTYDNVVLTFMFLGGSFGLFLCVLVIWRLSATTGNEYADTAEYLKRKNAKYTAPDKLTPASTPKGTSLDFSNVEEISLAEEVSLSRISTGLLVRSFIHSFIHSLLPCPFCFSARTQGSSSASASTSPPKAAQQSSISSFFGAGEKQTERADGTYA